jgi:hypothetical protein
MWGLREIVTGLEMRDQVANSRWNLREHEGKVQWSLAAKTQITITSANHVSVALSCKQTISHFAVT